MHRTHHFCIFGHLPSSSDAERVFATAPRPPLQSVLGQAQAAMHAQTPLVLLALLLRWRVAAASDAHTRALSLAPLALLSQQGHKRELLHAFVYVWERSVSAQKTPTHGKETPLVEEPQAAAGAGSLAVPISPARSSHEVADSSVFAPSCTQTPLPTTATAAAAANAAGAAAAATLARAAFDAAMLSFDPSLLLHLPELVPGLAATPLLTIAAETLSRGIHTLGGGLAGAGMQQHHAMAAGMGGRDGSVEAPQQASVLSWLRFLWLYVRHAPRGELEDAWTRLLALLRAGASLEREQPRAPMLLLLLMRDAVARLRGEGDGEGCVEGAADEAEAACSGLLTRARERREAQEALEVLLRASGAQLTRATRASRLPIAAGGGAAGSPPAPPPALPELTPGARSWEDPSEDVGVISLIALELCALPLLRGLLSSTGAEGAGVGSLGAAHLSRLRERAERRQVEMLDALMPALLRPLEDATAPPPRSHAHTTPPTALALRAQRLACGSLRVLLSLLGAPYAQRVWRRPVGRLFAAQRFWEALSRLTLPLWAKLVNAWLGLETPKAAMELLLAGKASPAEHWFMGAAERAGRQADLLRRLAFALWAGEHSQYVGALQGMLLDRLVAAFKYGRGGEGEGGCGSAAGRARVQAEALLASRVLCCRVAPEQLVSFRPVLIAELQRVLLTPEETPPAVLLAACQLVDVLLAVHPSSEGFPGWIFVPRGDGRAAHGDFVALLHPLLPADEGGTLEADQARGSGDASMEDFKTTAIPRQAEASRAAAPPAGGLLRPSPHGRRRPLLGLQRLTHMRELVPFATQLRAHLARAALQTRGCEVDWEVVDQLLGCAFLSEAEALLELAPYWRQVTPTPLVPTPHHHHHPCIPPPSRQEELEDCDGRGVSGATQMRPSAMRTSATDVRESAAMLPQSALHS